MALAWRSGSDLQLQRAKGASGGSPLHCSTVLLLYAVQQDPGVKHSDEQPVLGGTVHRGHPNDLHSMQRRSEAGHGMGDPTQALNSSIPLPSGFRTDPWVPAWSSEDQQLSLCAGGALPAESGLRWQGAGEGEEGEEMRQMGKSVFLRNHSFRFVLARKGCTRSENPTFQV